MAQAVSAPPQLEVAAGEAASALHRGIVDGDAADGSTLVRFGAWAADGSHCNETLG